MRRAATVSGLLLALCLTPAVALAAYTPAPHTVTEETGIAGTASTTDFQMPTGEPLKLASVTYSRSFGYPIWIYFMGEWMNVHSNGWLEYTNFDEKNPAEDGAQAGEGRPQFQDFDFGVSNVVGGKDGLALVAGLGFESSILGDQVCFYNQTSDGTPWVLSGSKVPTFPRGGRQVLNDLDDGAYPRPWPLGFPEYKGSGNTTLGAVSPAPDWGVMVSRNPGQEAVRAILVYSSVPSTKTAGIYEHRETIFYSDRGRVSRTQREFQRATPDYTAGFAVHANGSQMNAAPAFALNDGGWSQGTMHKATLSLSQSLVTVAAFSTLGAEVQRLYYAQPKLHPFPQDGGDPPVVDPNQNVPNLNIGELGTFLTDKLTPLTTPINSLLWPLKLFNDFIGE
jgi:hypothetical protein